METLSGEFDLSCRSRDEGVEGEGDTASLGQQWQLIGIGRTGGGMTLPGLVEMYND